MSISSPSVKTTILTAPQGWGKTRNAETLRREFQCTSIVDEYSPGKPLKSGALHLTNAHPSEFRNNKPALYRLVSRGWE